MPQENQQRWVGRKFEEELSQIPQANDTTSAAMLSPSDIAQIKSKFTKGSNSVNINSISEGGILSCPQDMFGCPRTSFELYFELQLLANGIFFNTSIGGIALGMSGYNGGTQTFNAIEVINLTVASVIVSIGTTAVGEKFSLNVVYNNGVITCIKNGVSSTSSTVSWTLGDWNNNFSLGYSYAPTLYGGSVTCYRILVFNKVLNNTERSVLWSGRNPCPTPFTRETVKYASTNPFDGYAQSANLPVISGNDVSTVVTAGNMVRIRPFVGRPGIVKAGMQIRLTFTVDVDLGTINPLSTTGTVVFAFEGVNVPRPAGTYDIIYNVRSDSGFSPGQFTFDDVVFFFVIANTGTLNITNLHAEILGCLIQLEPENILQTGRWMDISGNNNDMIPNPGAGDTTSGIHAISDLDSYTRRIPVVRNSVNVSGSTTTTFTEISYGSFGTRLMANPRLGGPTIRGKDTCIFAWDGSAFTAGIFPVANPKVNTVSGHIEQTLAGAVAASGNQTGYLIVTYK